MNGSLWRRISLLLALAVAGVPAAAQMPEVAWMHVPEGCAVTPGRLVPVEGDKPQIVACGDEGSFVFGRPGLQYGGDCPDLASGVEAPAAIPVEPAPRLPRTFPCPGGNCLGRSPGRPWIAMLDWPTAHGWSVAAMVREASDQRLDVELYDLTAIGTLAEWVPPVSDLNVLVQLCGLEEYARKHPGDRPVALNMSFGRRTTGAGCKTSEPGLGCSVSRVLSHLVKDEGIVAVAAAGNHRALLFPAASPDVISAGALDLSVLAESHEARPSMQTPPEAAALMLGYGIYLTLPAAGEGSPYWPAPPGSSYAAAMLTGWLGGTVAGGAVIPDPPLREGARWTPVTTPSGLALALDGMPLPGSELSGPRHLLERAMGAMPVLPEPPVSVTLRLDGRAPTLPELPVLYADDGNGPQPGVWPCLPCEGGREQGLALENADTVVVDLSYSEALPSRMDLVAVFLRVGGAVYSFEGCRHPDLLAAMAAGNLKGLAFSEVGGIFVAGEQPSLELVVNVGGLAYWHEIPIHLR